MRLALSKTILFFTLSTLLISCGGGGGDSKKAVEPVPAPVNKAPVMSSFETTYQVVENTELITSTITVSDPENDELSVTIAGVDAELFDFDLASGILKFKSAPDFEVPTDSDQNGVYQLELSISDGELSTEATIDVIVVNDMGIKIISPVGNSNIGDSTNFDVVAKIIDPETDDLTYLSSLELQINGNTATATDDTYQYWTYDLESPAQSDITAQFTFNEVTYNDSISVIGITPLMSVQEIVIDEEAEELYVREGALWVIAKVSFDGSSSEIFFDPIEHGYYSATSMLLDKQGNRLLVMVTTPQIGSDIWSEKSLLAIDLTSKNITVISDETIGSGKLLSINTGQLAFYNGDIIVPDYNNASLVKIDLSSGNRTTISSDLLGNGPSLERVRGLAIDSSVNKAYATSNSSIIEIDLMTGNRAIIGDDAVGSGVEISYPRALFLDKANDRLVFLNTNMGIVTLNLSTKVRELLPSPGSDGAIVLGVDNTFFMTDLDKKGIVSGKLGENEFISVIETKTGEGLQINAVPGMNLVYSPEKQHLFTLDWSGILSINLETKKRAIINATATPFVDRYGLALLSDNNTLLTIHNSGPEEIALLSFNAVEGVSTTLSSYNANSVVNFNNPLDLVVEPNEDFVYVLDGPNYQNLTAEVNILKVDLISGEKEIVTNNAMASGVDLTESNAITYRKSNNSLILIQEPESEVGVEIVSVDLTSGNRSLIANDIMAKVITQTNNIAMLNDETLLIMSWNVIYRVNLTTGESEVVSSKEKGEGVPFGQLMSFTYDASKQIIFAVDGELGGVFSIDVNTGNRSLLLSGFASSSL